MTLPVVKSSRKILMVGDSVLFGVGVNDGSTIASNLQRRIGSAYTIVNAGVGDYSGIQAFEMANELSKKREYVALIYIASQNDFMTERGISFTDQASPVLQRFSSLKERFSGRIVVMLVTYMEYNLRDVLLEQGWWRQTISETDKLRRGLRKITEDMDLGYVDFTDIVEKYMTTEGSIFARFSLYVDHAHLSPMGNSVAGQELYEALKKINVVSGE